MLKVPYWTLLTGATIQGLATSNSCAGPTTENGTSKMPEDAPAADDDVPILNAKRALLDEIGDCDRRGVAASLLGRCRQVGEQDVAHYRVGGVGRLIPVVTPHGCGVFQIGLQTVRVPTALISLYLML